MQSGLVARLSAPSHRGDLYLVGDIVDGWNWGPYWHWSPAQQEVVSEVRQWRRGGVNVVFLPGNHDEAKVGLVEELFGPILRPDR